MGTRIPALVQPPLLVWAREEAGYTLEQASMRVRFKTEKLHAWETGKTQPTLRQAERLAKIYHKPMSVFYLQAIPKTRPLSADYRRLPGVKPGEESPELRFALRELVRRRLVALSLFAELGHQPESLGLIARLEESPETVAARVREALGISVEAQKEWANEFQAWREWRSAIERLGVLVFQFSKVDVKEVRGVSLLDFPVPIIGINNREIPSSKPFSVIHELVHVILANASEESPAIEERRPEREWQLVEKFAERVAGAVLMPQEALANEPSVRDHRVTADWETSDVGRLARQYKVTPSALATRLLSIGRITPVSYRKWKDAWELFLEEHPPRNKGGIATPAEKSLNRNGTSFTLLVLEALTSDRITSVDAANYLELSYPHIESLQRDLVFGRERKWS